MKILCWNLGVAFGRWRDQPDLHERAWHWIAALDPDLAFLQESVPPVWASERWHVLVGPHQSFASALVARRGIELQPVTLPPGGALDLFGSYLATAEIRLADGERLLVSSVHTSAKAAPEWGHPGFERTAIARSGVGVPWWNDVAFAGFRELVAKRRFLISGDWNTARWLDAEGVPNADGAEFFTRAADAGWVDLSLDDAGREGKTWYGSDNPRPYQPDHAFADLKTATAARSFTIEPWPVSVLGLSDHAPLVVDIDIGVPGLPVPATLSPAVVHA